ncbi:MAG: TolC family protein [Bdellovibrionales bacterium]|nr:TolC family protein [Bdellovibrionales bacterium]
MKWIFFLTLFTATAFAQAHAQSLTLPQATNEARQNNPELQQLKARAERLSWAKLEAVSTYLPHISAKYEHYFQSHYMRENVVFGGATVGFPAAYPQDNLGLEAEITVFDGFRGLDQFKAARLATEAAELDMKHADRKVEEAVRASYYQALAAQKLFLVAQQNVKTLEDHLSRAHVSERAGYGVRFDVLRIQATLEEARAEQEAADNNVHITRAALTEILGRTQTDDRPLVGELPVFSESDVPKEIDLNPEARDDVRAQMKRDAATMKEAAAAGAFWFPSVSLFANEQFYKFGDFDSAVQPNSNYQNAWAVGLRLKWNLFDGGRSYAHQREASQAAAEARAETQKTLARLPRELDTWRRRFQYSVALYKARLHALAQFQESVRLAGIGVRTGTRTHTEMLDAELDLFRARGGLVRAQADAVEALGKLELAAGHKLWTPHD